MISFRCTCASWAVNGKDSIKAAERARRMGLPYSCYHYPWAQWSTLFVGRQYHKTFTNGMVLMLFGITGMDYTLRLWNGYINCATFWCLTYDDIAGPFKESNCS